VPRRVGAPAAAAKAAAEAGSLVHVGTAFYSLGSGGWTSSNGAPVPHLASGGLVYDPATGAAISIHAGVQPCVAGGRLPFPPGVHIAVPSFLSVQAVSALVLGPEGSLFAFDASGVPMGTVPYNLSPEEAATASAAAASASIAKLLASTALFPPMGPMGAPGMMFPGLPMGMLPPTLPPAMLPQSSAVQSMQSTPTVPQTAAVETAAC
jgi:hypothetical protein